MGLISDVNDHVSADKAIYIHSSPLGGMGISFVLVCLNKNSSKVLEKCSLTRNTGISQCFGSFHCGKVSCLCIRKDTVITLIGAAY